MKATVLCFNYRNNFAKLNVYFKSTTGISYVMDQRTTWADFICKSLRILNSDNFS